MGRSRIAAIVGVPLVMAAIVAACGFRLVADPSSLIVDGTRPSVDHAWRGHQRGVGNDLTSVFLPRFLHVVGQLRTTGKIPGWDATGFGGRPLLGNPQAGLFYPPAWAALATGDPAALGWLTMAHLVWAGVGVYVLGRSLGMGRGGAIVAGACFEASPYLLAHVFEGHYPHVWGVAWYPWAFWALRGALRFERHAAWGLPVILALAFLTGHAQEWYYLVVALGAWMGLDALGSFRRAGARAAWPKVAVGAGLVVVSLALSAVELYPEVEVAPWSLRSGLLSLADISRYHVRSINLVQAIQPFALGGPADYFGHDNYWENLFSIGFVSLALALIGVFGPGDAAERARVRPWVGLVVVAAVLAAGRRLGLFALAFRMMPGMDRFRVPSRTLFLATLGAAVLAGLGVDKLLKAGGKSSWRWCSRRMGLAWVGAVAVVIVICLVSTTGKISPISPKYLNLAIEASEDGRSDRMALAARRIAGDPLFWVASVGIGVGLVMVTHWPRRRAWVAWGWGLLAVGELACHGARLLVCAPAERFLNGDDPVLSLRVREDESSGPWRVASTVEAYPDVRAVAAGREKTNVNDGYQVQHAADLYETLYPFLEPVFPPSWADRPMDAAVIAHRSRFAKRVLDLMSVRYVFTGHVPQIPGLTGRSDGSTLAWENEGALPRAYVVPSARVAPGGFKRIEPLLTDFDPRSEVLLVRDPIVGHGARQPFTPARWEATGDPDRVVIRVETRAPGLLVVGNTWMPGWTAKVDAQDEWVLRGNHCQQVVAIRQPGEHEVVLRYRAPGYRRGLWITSASLIGWSSFGVVLAFWPAIAARLARRRIGIRSPEVAGELRGYGRPSRRSPPSNPPVLLS